MRATLVLASLDVSLWQVCMEHIGRSTLTDTDKTDGELLHGRRRAGATCYLIDAVHALYHRHNTANTITVSSGNPATGP